MTVGAHRVAVVLLSIVLGSACGAGASAPVASIDADTFVAVYVGLRTAALDADSGRVGDSARAEILSAHGVTEAELVQFVEVHGEDLAYMKDVWERVETRLDRARPDRERTP